MTKRRTHTVNLSLPQTRGRSVSDLYELLRKRAFAKSNTDKSRQGKKAPLLILEFAHRAVDLQMGVIVERESFLAEVDPDTLKETSFVVRIDSVLGTGTLHVFANGKAFVEED